MNRPELFVKSVDILVDAYNQGKLKHLTPCNCAVGNLIAYRKGSYTKVDETWIGLISDMRLSHRKSFLTLNNIKKLKPTLKDSVKTIYNGNVEDTFDFHQSIFDKKYLKKGLDEIKMTEYTLDEIEKIERAFEEVNPETGRYDSSEGNYRDREASESSMMRVIAVLGKIHDIPKKTVKCMQDQVKNKTYKFSYKFKNAKPRKETNCPIVQSTK